MASKKTKQDPDELLNKPESTQPAGNDPDNPFEKEEKIQSDFYSKLPGEQVDLDNPASSDAYVVSPAKRDEQEIDMPSTTYALVESMIYLSWRTKQGVLLFGDPGIGKSSIVEATTRRIGKDVNCVHRKYLQPTDEVVDGKFEGKKVFNESRTLQGKLLVEDVWNFDEIELTPGAKVKNAKTGEYGVVKKVTKKDSGIEIDVTPLSGADKTSVLHRRFVLEQLDKKRDFREFTELSEQGIDAVLEQPGMYFVYLCVNAVGMDPILSGMGVPKIGNQKDYLRTEQEPWIHIFKAPESAGILFIDEINRGSQEILNFFLPLVLDRKAHTTKLAGDFNIIAAGNLADEAQGTRQIPDALLKRFKCGTLVVSPEDFIDIAINKLGAEPEIISFIRSQPNTNFRTKPDPQSPESPIPTPRAIMMADKELKELKKGDTIKELQGLVSKSPKRIGAWTILEQTFSELCGVKWSRNFVAYLKNMRMFNLNELYNDRANIHTYDASKLYALLAYTAQRTINILKKHDINNDADKLADNEKLQLAALFEIVKNTGAASTTAVENITQFVSYLMIYAQTELKLSNSTEDRGKFFKKYVPALLSAPISKERMDGIRSMLKPIADSMSIKVDDIMSKFLTKGEEQ